MNPFVLLVTSAFTQGSVLDVAQSYDAIEVINRAVAYAIIASAFLSVVFVFYGGVSFILSGGSEDKIQQAVGTIRYAIVGLVVTMLSVVVVGFVGGALGVNAIKYINLNEVFGLINQITSGGNSGRSSLDSLN